MSSQHHTNYPCYALVDGAEIQQGDLLDRCPVVVFLPNEAIEEEETELETDIGYQDVVVMSQTCDLMNDKIDLVLLCPVWTYDDYAKEYEYFRSSKGKRDLQQGNLPGYHLINGCEIDGFERGLSIVDFHNVYSLPLEYLRGFAEDRGERVRLMPPYREHLSQAFARFFMRVGLPVDVTIP